MCVVVAVGRVNVCDNDSVCVSESECVNECVAVPVGSVNESDKLLVNVCVCVAVAVGSVMV